MGVKQKVEVLVNTGSEGNTPLTIQASRNALQISEM